MVTERRREDRDARRMFVSSERYVRLELKGKCKDKSWLGEVIHSHPSLCHPNEQRPLAGDPGDCDGRGTRSVVVGRGERFALSREYPTLAAKARRRWGTRVGGGVSYSGFAEAGAGWGVVRGLVMSSR